MVVRVLILGFILGLASSFCDAKSVIANGYGVIADNDIADARKQAISDAKRVAIEQLFGSYISARTETRNFMLASEKIYSTTKGKIDRFDIIEEKPVDDNTFSVKIEAFVDEGAMRNTVDETLSQYNWFKKPRIAINTPKVTAESAAFGSNGFSQTFANYLSQHLAQIGFTIIQQKNPKIGASFELDAALQVSVTQNQFQGMDIASNQLLADVVLKQASTGVVVTSTAESAQKAGGNSFKVIDQLADKLAYRIAQRISLDTKVKWLSNNAQPVVMSIKGDHSAASLTMDFINQWVVGLDDYKVESTDSSTTTVLVSYQGWPEQFTDQLFELTKQNLTPFVIEKMHGATISLAVK